jgi:hypothetical protein
MMNKTPVLVLAFNRSDFLAEILSALPLDRKIYVHIDGPNVGNQSEVENCLNVSRIFSLNNPTVPIEIKFQNHNLGNKKAFIAATSWAFGSESQLIILEDDIRFSNSFFPFMDWALEKFKYNKRVFQINGFSVLDKIPGRDRLFESMNCFPWGWGTWRDRWVKLDLNNRGLNTAGFRDYPIFGEVKRSQEFDIKWADRFQRVNAGLDTYDYELNATVWSFNMVAISPRFTFTTNIGFDKRSLHTFRRPKYLRRVEEIHERQFDYQGGKVVSFPSSYDAYSDLLVYGHPGIIVGSARFIIYIYNIFKRFRKVLCI